MAAPKELKLLQAEGTVWVFDWQSVPLEVPAVRLSVHEYLIYHEGMWQQRSYSTIALTRAEAIRKKLSKAETSLSLAKQDVERLKSMLAKEEG